MVRTRSMGGDAVMQLDAKLVHLVRRYSTRQERSEWLQAPLDSTAKAGDLEVVEALVDSGADVNGVFGAESDTALHVAAAWDRPAVVQALVRAGADTTNTNRRGCTALRLACSRGHPAVVPVMIGAGASVDAYDLRWRRDIVPLRDAALGGHAEVVRQLLDAGAEVDAGYGLVGQRSTCLSLGPHGGHAAAGRRRLRCGRLGSPLARCCACRLCSGGALFAGCRGGHGGLGSRRAYPSPCCCNEGAHGVCRSSSRGRCRCQCS